ncbi:MAG: NrsF family protein [Povalibacter sp.]
MNEIDVPASLLSQVRADLEPVTPLASPSRRLLALVPLALILFFGPPMFWGWRINLELLPSWTSWGLSALESLAGVALMALALREAVPGLAVRVRWMWLAFAGGAFLFTSVSLTTAHVLPTPIGDAGAWTRLAWECVFMELPFALPSLAISAWLVGRALPTRPAFTGAAYGFAIGLMTDAGMRLFCRIDEPFHVFAAHGGVILLGATGGALTAMIIERAKYRRLQIRGGLDTGLHVRRF